MFAYALSNSWDANSGMSPDQELFESHLTQGDFQKGVVLGYWGQTVMPSIAWPCIIIWIQAVPRPKSPDRYFFRFTLDGYPKEAPSAFVCDPRTGSEISPQEWPNGAGDVAMVFCVNNWENRKALYAPWDRAGLRCHPEWKTTYAADAWSPRCSITHFLSRTHVLLNCDDYTGTVAAANS